MTGPSKPPAAAVAGAQVTPPLALIASVARNGCIGQGGDLLWREPEDMRYFRRQTLGCPVIMGRKTWDSLPERFRPLPGRDNIVVTRQGDWIAPGARVAHSLAKAVALARQTPARRIFVIGGGQLYAAALPWAHELMLTEIDADLPGDTVFPAWDRTEFIETSREPHHSEGQAGFAFAFVCYHRKPQPAR